MSLNLGHYQLDSVHTGFLSLDGGAMFGTVPKVLWEKHQPPDEKNRIKLAMRALLIRGEGRTILVDCGLGDKGGDKFKEMFNVDQTAYHLHGSLQNLGLKTSDITDVILTHLHFDHAGGATFKDEQGQWQPTFANATYYIQEKNLSAAQTPNPRERASYLPEIYGALVEQKRLKALVGNQELFKDISLWVSNGHTEAQQHVLVSGGEQGLFYGGDLIPMHSHIPLAWIMGYDLHPLKMLEEKEVILKKAQAENIVMFYEHDPKVVAQKIIASPKGFVATDALEF